MKIPKIKTFVISVILLALTFILGLYFGKSYTLEKINPSNIETVNNYLGKCPYYVPDGNAWKECLNDEVSKSNKELELLINEIKSDSKITGERLMSRGEGVIFENLENIIDETYSSWTNYKNAKCFLDNQDSSNVSSYDGLVSICILEENEHFASYLKGINYKFNIEFEEALEAFEKTLI